MNKEIKTSTALITIFAAAVIFIGGALSYFYYTDPNSYLSSIDATQVKSNGNANSAIDAATADWKTYTNTTYGLSFKYPKEWESTKSEITIEPAQGELANDLVLKVQFYNPAQQKQIDCANNEFQNWADTKLTQAECQPVLAGLTADQKSKLTGPRSPENIFVRVFTKANSFTALKDWLYTKYHQPNTELERYEVGQAVTLDGKNGYFSSIGCCGGIDRNYVVEANGFVYMLGSNYFETTIDDKNMPALFTKIAETFKVNDLTADWKTYTNSDYNYSIKYPINSTAKDWITTIKGTPDSAKSNSEMLSMVGFGKNTSEFDSDYSVTVTTKTIQTEIELLGYSVPNAITSDVTIDGVKGTKATGRGAAENSVIEENQHERNWEIILLPKDGKVYKIYMTKDNQVLFDRAVSTFRFN